MIVCIFCMTLSLTCFGNHATGQAIVNVAAVDATVKIGGQAAQKLFESLEVFARTDGSTVSKETSEVACFQYNEKITSTYSCVIFVFVSKDFISTKSRYFENSCPISIEQNH